MALQRDNGVAGKEDMLTSIPCDWWVLDGNSRGVVGQRCKLGFACPKTFHIALTALLRMEEGNIGIDDIQGTNQAVEEEESDWNPDIDVAFSWCVDIHHTNE